MSYDAIRAATGELWPYLVVICIGFLPTEMWRIAAIVLAKNLDAESEILHWVRLVASALLAAVVVKLLFAPSGALAVIPLWGKLGAMVAGLSAMVVFRRSVIAAVIVGEAVLISTGYWG